MIPLTWAVLVPQPKVGEVEAAFGHHVSVHVEHGGEAAVDDLGRHGRVGEQEARAEELVAGSRLCKTKATGRYR